MTLKWDFSRSRVAFLVFLQEVDPLPLPSGGNQNLDVRMAHLWCHTVVRLVKPPFIHWKRENWGAAKHKTFIFIPSPFIAVPVPFPFMMTMNVLHMQGNPSVHLAPRWSWVLIAFFLPWKQVAARPAGEAQLAAGSSASALLPSLCLFIPSVEPPSFAWIPSHCPLGLKTLVLDFSWSVGHLNSTVLYNTKNGCLM